jgi:hypothetical protein
LPNLNVKTYQIQRTSNKDKLALIRGTSDLVVGQGICYGRNAFVIRWFAEVTLMSHIGPMSSMGTGIAASAVGSSSAGAADRTAKLDAANHSLAAGQKDLSSHPLDRDASTAADRDADGWTGDGSATPDDTQRETTDAQLGPNTPPIRLRLPDDPCGGTLDVSV